MTGSVQAKNGKWYCVLNLKVSGKRKQKWIPTGLSKKGNKKKAQAQLQKLLMEYSVGNTSTDYAMLPFPEYCRIWLEGKRTSLEVSTYEGYETRIRHIQEYFADKTLAEITARDIRDFYNYLLEKGNRAKYKRTDGLSCRTVKEVSLVLKAIFKEAMIFKDIESDPAKDVPVPKKKRAVCKKDIFLDENDVLDLQKEIHGHVLEDLILITLFYGLRRSEVLGIQWTAIDFQKNLLDINHTVVKVKQTIEKDTVKTDASFRQYPLSDFTRGIFEKIWEQQQCNRKIMGDCYHESDYVFTWEDGRPFSPDYVTKAFKKIVTRSETLPSELVFHDLRKSCVSIMIADGHSIKEVQKWVGHSDIATTLNIYAKVKESRKKEIAKKMDEKFVRAS